jgi:hypothetical protein
LTLIDEKNWSDQEFENIFVEDTCKEEPHYIDYLCSIHNELVEKYENLEGY